MAAGDDKDISTTRTHSATAGVVLFVCTVLAFAACVCCFVMGFVGVGTSAFIAALLSSAGGLAWLSEHHRWLRDREPVSDGAGRYFVSGEYPSTRSRQS